MSDQISFIREKYELMKSNVETLEMIPGSSQKLIDRFKAERDRYWRTLQDLRELDKKRRANEKRVDPK